MSETLEANVIPATEPVPTSDAAAVASEAAEKADAKPDAKPDAKHEMDPRDLAIKDVSFKFRDTKRQLAAVLAELALYKPAPDANDPPDADALTRMIEERATALISERESQTKIDHFTASGNAAYPDFTQRCNQLADMGARDSPTFMQAITVLPDGYKLVASLAESPSEAIRVLGLPPVEMMLALIKMGAPAQADVVAKAPVAAVSRAPAPIRPIAAQSQADFDPSKLEGKAFQAWYNKHTRG